MKPHTSDDIHGYARWLTQACQAAGLDAEQYGAEILVRGATSHLSERITCRPDERGELAWHWSWGVAIGRPEDPTRPLGVEDVEELVRSIGRVVGVPLRKPR